MSSGYRCVEKVEFDWYRWTIQRCHKAGGLSSDMELSCPDGRMGNAVVPLPELDGPVLLEIRTNRGAMAYLTNVGQRAVAWRFE